MKIKLFLVIIGISLSGFVAEAHRSGCHRWRTCPSDSGSYGTVSTPVTVSVPNRPQPVAKPLAPARPRFAVRGVSYVRAADLLPKSLGSVQQISGGWKLVSVRKARLWLRVGSRAIRIALNAGSKPVNRSLSATPYNFQNSFFLPAEVLRLAGCQIDTSRLSSGFITVTCGSQVAVVPIKRY